MTHLVCVHKVDKFSIMNLVADFTIIILWFWGTSIRWTKTNRQGLLISTFCFSKNITRQIKSRTPQWHVKTLTFVLIIFVATSNSVLWFNVYQQLDRHHFSPVMFNRLFTQDSCMSSTAVKRNISFLSAKRMRLLGTFLKRKSSGQTLLSENAFLGLI